MKNLLFIISLVLINSMVKAQINKGDKLLGTRFGSFNYSKNNSESANSFSSGLSKSETTNLTGQLEQNISWFIADRLAVGTSAILYFSQYKSENNTTGVTTIGNSTSNRAMLLLGPTARYYLSPLNNKKGVFFTEASVNKNLLITDKTKQKYSDKPTNNYASSSKLNGDFGGGINLGYEYFLKENIGIVGTVGAYYSSNKSTSKVEYDSKPASNYSSTYKSTTLRFPINIALQFHLIKKKTVVKNYKTGKK
jgi:outer membrane protein W